MQNQKRESQSFGIELADIYYILFRHKWKIIFCCTLGVVVAAVLDVVKTPLYQSEAKLFVRYVLESKSISAAGSDSKVKTPDERGENIINSELEILTSLDLAEQVADAIGPEKILAKAGGGKERFLAASLIKKNLSVEIPRRSSIIRVIFQHPDPEIVQPVLKQLIDHYFKKHVEVHRGVGLFDDFLTQQTDTLRSRLNQTEEEFRKSKIKAGVISLEDSKKAYAEQISKMRWELLNAEAELWERQVTMKEMGKPQQGKPEAAPAEPVAPPEKLNEYRKVSTLLDFLAKREQELLIQFTAESSRVKEVRGQIEEAEKLKKKLAEENPLLARLPAQADRSLEQDRTLQTETVRIVALQAKIQILNSQLERIRTEASGLSDMEATITELQRKKEMEENQYRYYSASLEQTRIDEALGAGKISNIGVAQAPSAPFKDSSELHKLLAKVVAGGVFGGILLAFLLELYLDRTLKRPIEIETHMRLPLFLTIPDTSRNGHSRLIKASGNGQLPLPASENRNGHGENGANGKIVPAGKADIAPWEDSHCLRPFYEALRDRLVTSFEVRKLTHKPKLVAVTGCAHGAGVTSIAVGLAATLSETGDGNVLLVDMNIEHGAAHHFYKGKPSCGLEDALENEKRDTALVQENLYVVTEGKNSDKLPRILPRRFANLVPKLKASDYDYIIFDMPPVSPISVTPRLAGFMDMVLLVVESEKDQREAIRRATVLLTESNATVSAVLNKNRSYVPAWLHQEM